MSETRDQRPETRDQRVLSVVVPMYYEQENVNYCYERVKSILTSLDKYDHEIIFVNDGSTDDSWRLMLEIADKDPKFKPINLSRNFGQQIATTAGLSYCSGDFAFIIDGDLQHPPELFPKMLSMCENEGYDSVYAIQLNKKKISIFKKLFSKYFYRFFNSMSSVKIPPNTGDFRIINRKMIDTYLKMPEQHRFIRGQFAWMGFNQGSIEFDLPIRELGTPKFTLSKSLKLAFDGLFLFSFKPISIVLCMAMFFSLITVGMFLLCLVMWYLQYQQMLLLVILFSLFFISTIFLFVFALLGEYIVRTYQQVLGRPIFVVSDSRNF